MMYTGTKLCWILAIGPAVGRKKRLCEPKQANSLGLWGASDAARPSYGGGGAFNPLDNSQMFPPCSPHESHAFSRFVR